MMELPQRKSTGELAWDAGQENHRLRTDNEALKRERDQACDRIDELQGELRRMRVELNQAQNDLEHLVQMLSRRKAA